MPAGLCAGLSVSAPLLPASIARFELTYRIDCSRDNDGWMVLGVCDEQVRCGW